jgi:hypothetical protein
MRRKKQKWNNGSLFKVPLLDGAYVIGLVFATTSELSKLFNSFLSKKTLNLHLVNQLFHGC